jgi:hypothetical protein
MRQYVFNHHLLFPAADSTYKSLFYILSVFFINNLILLGFLKSRFQKAFLRVYGSYTYLVYHYSPVIISHVVWCISYQLFHRFWHAGFDKGFFRLPVLKIGLVDREMFTPPRYLIPSSVDRGLCQPNSQNCIF